jgi:hypothetical protein
MDATTLLVGVDDTDNVSSRGTGFLVQRLIAEIEAAGMARALGATHHQLLVDPAIPYTSHNSSACIAVVADEQTSTQDLIGFCGEFLESESAPGSDPGLVVATRQEWEAGDAAATLAHFGRSAKTQVLDYEAAVKLADTLGVHASGHGGTHGGIIGALAAVGLHLSGSDGFFLWMPGIRELEGRPTYDELRRLLPIDMARDLDGAEPDGADIVELVDWIRPVWTDSRAVLLILPALGDHPPAGSGAAVWRLAPRYLVRAFNEPSMPPGGQRNSGGRRGSRD